MRYPRWRLSGLVLLFALVASACSSDPTELVVGQETDAGDVVEEDAEDAMEEGVTDSEAGSMVADDSAPIESFSDPIDEQSAAIYENNAVAWSTWSAAEIQDYDFSVVVESAEFNLIAQIEVRGGEVTRELTHPADAGGYPGFSDMFEGLPEAILDGDVETVTYHPELGYPVLITGIDQGQPARTEISRFRTLDDYPETCSTADIDSPGPTDDDPISRTRALLLEAVQTCDYLMLSHLADEGVEELITSFGGGGVEVLWQAEKAGDLRLGIMAELVSQQPAFLEDGTAVWPEEFADPSSGYTDWRVGIAADGEWLFFVAGD